jgi:hypothetical protein
MDCRLDADGDWGENRTKPHAFGVYHLRLALRGNASECRFAHASDTSRLGGQYVGRERRLHLAWRQR